MVAAPLAVDIPIREFARLFETAPRPAFFHLRDTMGAVFGSHRREWLKRTKAKIAFKRKKTGRLATVKGLGIFYNVFPKRKGLQEGQTLEDISGESFTTSEAAHGLEVGGTFRPRKKYFAIPIGAALRKGKASGKRQRIKGLETPEQWRQKGRRLVVLPHKFVGFPPDPNARGIGLYWRKGRGKREILLPVFHLVPQIEQKPILRFHATWDDLRADRDRRFANALTAIVNEVARKQKKGAKRG